MDTAVSVSQPPEYDIHLAKEADIESVCNILASAFTNDPVMAWLSGYVDIYASLFRFELEALYRQHGQVYINREVTGAALWLPPGVYAKPAFHWRLLNVLWGLAWTGGYQSLKRADDLKAVFAHNHPREPHFYLHAIGASLNNQGRGIGSALLKAGLSVCDQQGAPAYLESTNEKNNALYERYGFEVINKVALPSGGPNIWFMYRNPRLPK